MATVDTINSNLNLVNIKFRANPVDIHNIKSSKRTVLNVLNQYLISKRASIVRDGNLPHCYFDDIWYLVYRKCPMCDTIFVDGHYCFKCAADVLQEEVRYWFFCSSSHRDTFCFSTTTRLSVEVFDILREHNYMQWALEINKVGDSMVFDIYVGRTGDAQDLEAFVMLEQTLKEKKLYVSV